ncbi:hypothetical protein ACFOYW_11545 [Gryllotalpicola reticulitermitis]|uniref:Uncharacterized protein n=1 Tax=Gryllotalpicola reticulitermitis TaxID=1184153 RepID=A0ABV8Q8B4_9MICO
MTTRRVKSSGAIELRGVTHQVARELAGQTIFVAMLAEGVKFYDSTGGLLLKHSWPAPGTKHVRDGRPSGAGAKRPEHVTKPYTKRLISRPPNTTAPCAPTGGSASEAASTASANNTPVADSTPSSTMTTTTFSDAATGEIIAEHLISEPGTMHVGYVRYNRRTPTFEPTKTVSDERSEMS